MTEGFRDSIEIAFEHRFEQYDIFMVKPSPLVPRDLRFGIPERLDGRGNVLIPLDEDAVHALAPKLKEKGVESIAIGYMHAYLDGKHERRTGEILAKDAARRVDHALERSLARDPRVRALVDGGRQCLCPAGDGTLSWPPRYGTAPTRLHLPVVHDHLGRWPRSARDRPQVPNPARGVRARGRRHPGGSARTPVRARQGAELRHGRHHRQDLSDRQWRAAAFSYLRGGAAVPLPEGQRPAAAHPGDRDGRDRRGRRLDRPLSMHSRA